MVKHWLLMDELGPDGGHFRTRIAVAGRHLPATHLTTDDFDVDHNPPVMLVAAGAGIVAGAALYRMPAR